MSEELPKHYHFAEIQQEIYEKWLAGDAMRAAPDGRENRYVIMMPLPNVTGALHMGHAMDNVMQDLLIRWRRMLGDNTLWMPGTDHAGIGTQAVIEKRLLELEGKTRHDIGREALVGRIWKWKDEYEARIIDQQQAMGCSCDWKLHRFTMDDVCRRAVREAFFRLFQDGLIYRGDRLVNWDCQLGTAISDDEIVRQTTAGHFWHIRYPVIDPRPGEPQYVTVATTRPETMLGDTAVAVHPNPVSEVELFIDNTVGRLENASQREKAEAKATLDNAVKLRGAYLENLKKLVEMAGYGRKVRLPLMNREIPLILDEWAKPGLGSGAVKITPAHDPNDYNVWKKHLGEPDEIGVINLLNPDGTYNDNAGPYAGLDRFKVRERVVADLEAQGLLEGVEDREIELGLSDRSKTPVEPYLSPQWFVNMGDIEGGILCGKGTGREFKIDGLAEAAIQVARTVTRTSPTRSGLKLKFHPDGERYHKTYESWLWEKRDWCISRQLWWGHRIPIWRGEVDRAGLQQALELINVAGDQLCAWISAEDGGLINPADAAGDGPFALLVCIRGEGGEETLSSQLNELGLEQDPDVLDTWFSSALWPFSTLGWPDPATAEVGEGRRPLGGFLDGSNYLQYYYPGSCLVTGRDIITLWVARMQVMGLYLLGDAPFTDCFVHANIQDGKGERMSKSNGNGIDPVDIIDEYGADAMRYVLCDMQTGTQDIKLPVQAISPFTGERIDLAEAEHGRTIFTYIDPATGEEFDVLGTIPDLPRAKITSDRFEAGRAFCTKLWNACRFAFMNLGDYEYRPVGRDNLQPEDRWILSRLNRAIAEVTRNLEAYNPSAAIGAAREFFWSELCDWYLELIKPRLREADGLTARTVLAFAIDQTLRLFHPFVPFITEALWERFADQAPTRGLEQPLNTGALLISASWPTAREEWRDSEVESDFSILRDAIRAIRDLRAQYGVSPARKNKAVIKAAGEAGRVIEQLQRLLREMAGIEQLEFGADVERPSLAAVAVVSDMEIYLLGVLDAEKERDKLSRQKEKILVELERAKKKLTNRNFIEKAPPEVVQKERDRAAEMKAQLERINKSLNELA